MTAKKTYTLFTYCIAFVWFANGLFCKVFNLVPRHQQIVERILGTNNGKIFTILIGISEIVMAIWILIGYKSKLNAIVQIIVIATMNSIEFIMAPDLLLWGKANALFAFLFIIFIYYTNFVLKPKSISLQ